MASTRRRLLSSWPGVSRPPVAAPAGRGGPDDPPIKSRAMTARADLGAGWRYANLQWLRRAGACSRHGPACPGHLSRHLLVEVARTSRAMTARVDLGAGWRYTNLQWVRRTGACSRHGPACPGHLSRHGLVEVARTIPRSSRGRAMTARVDLGAGWRYAVFGTGAALLVAAGRQAMPVAVDCMPRRRRVPARSFAAPPRRRRPRHRRHARAAGSTAPNGSACRPPDRWP
jgi:hypothetical protein